MEWNMFYSSTILVQTKLLNEEAVTEAYEQKVSETENNLYLSTTEKFNQNIILR